MKASKHRLLFHGLTLAGMGLLLWSYAALPERVATHFGFSGQPDAWASKSTYLFLGLLTLALIWLLFFGLVAWIPRMPPEHINVPNKDFWMKKQNLPKLYDIFEEFMLVFGISTQIFLIGLGALVHQAQLSGGGLPRIEMGAWICVFFGFTVLWMFKMIRRYEADEAAAMDADDTP